jgi:hypothetical protein
VEHKGTIDALARSILFDFPDTVNLARSELVHIEQTLPSGIEPEN